ncbi:MAG: hypothetical protein R3D84_10750 [Paracoccaceae bacterium]
MTAPRLFVLTATDSPWAVILRRGPARRVATIGWNRHTGAFLDGQWLNGRIYEHRCDLSPDGRHMVVFAGTGRRWWTAVSRAPWLTAIYCEPQADTWGGGGAFTAEGHLWLGGGATDRLPKELAGAANRAAYPPSTDGFHMGATFVAKMTARGWRHVGGQGYDAVLHRDLSGGRTLEMRFEVGAKNRAIIANRYALIADDGTRRETDWEWAEPGRKGLFYAAGGCLWSQAQGGEPVLLRDFAAMDYGERRAPYRGVAR